MLNKSEVFDKELSWIKSDSIRAFATQLTECAPDYFFECAASSTGKYHPSYAIGPGGLVRHTKAAAHILHELLTLEMFNKYTQDQKDMMLAAIIAHDFFKHGLAAKASQYTVAEHPLVCANFVKENADLSSMLAPEQIEFICGCIASHMGQWNTDYRSKREILPKPQKGPQNMVHLADYLASRKYLIFDFEDDYYTPWVAPAEPENNAELEEAKSQILALCKAKTEAGIAKTTVYKLISELNGGSRNPNSITSMEIATQILHKLEELNG